MKRSAALAPLSRDHHHALEAALRLRRAQHGDLHDAVRHFQDFLEPRGRRHFEIEEELLVGALPETDGDWLAATARMLDEHARIRRLADLVAGRPAEDRLAHAHELGELLRDHVRFEEREVFPLLEARLPASELAALGAAVEAAEDAG
jgi:hemerythrin-like domain-containing protein